MEKRTIPDTDLQVSALCLGGGGFCDLSKKEETFRVFDLFYEQGGNFIDTANIYGRWLPEGKNSSELLIGEWMASRGCRENMVITTKGAHPPLEDMSRSRLSRQEIQEDIDSSLKALGVDRIDLYYLHRDDENRTAAEIMESLNDFVKAGKLRYPGVSNWSAQRIAQANDYARSHGLQPIVANQPMWSLAAVDPGQIPDKTLRAMDDEMYMMHMQTGMAAVPYSSQAQGYFTKLEKQPERARLMEQYDNDINRMRFERVKELASGYGATVNQIALAYLISQPFPVVPIVGCRTEEALLDSLGAAELPRFSVDELLYLGLSAE